MCEPATIIGLTLSAASAVAGYSAQQRVQSAQNDAMAAERIRQSTLDKEAAAINDNSRQRYDGFEGQQNDRAGKLTAKFNEGLGEAAQGVAEGPTETLPTAASNIVTQERAKQLGKANAYSTQQGEALGKLRSFGSLLGDLSLDQARDAGEIGQIGSFKKGSANVHAYAMDAASKQGGNLKLFSDVLGGLGNVATTTGGRSAIGNLFGGSGSTGTNAMPGVYSGSVSSGYGMIPTSAVGGQVIR